MATTPEKIVANGGAFVGTPEGVTAQVRACVEAFGPIEPSMQINFGGLSTAEARRTMELFAREVIPAFRDDKDRLSNPRQATA